MKELELRYKKRDRIREGKFSEQGIPCANSSVDVFAVISMSFHPLSLPLFLSAVAGAWHSVRFSCPPAVPMLVSLLRILRYPSDRQPFTASDASSQCGSWPVWFCAGYFHSSLRIRSSRFRTLRVLAHDVFQSYIVGSSRQCVCPSSIRASACVPRAASTPNDPTERGVA